MNKKVSTTYLPIVSKGKIDNGEKTDKKISKLLTIWLITFFILLLLFCGYSMAKSLENYKINGKAEIAKPILEVENNPKIDITAKNNSGIYTFKVKNYNEKDEVTQTNLRYYIEIMSDVDDSVNIELFQDGNKINMSENKTGFIEMPKDVKQERRYEIKITYDKNKSQSLNDIMDKMQVKVHTEQVKA